LAKSTFYRKVVAKGWARRLEKRIKALSGKHPTYGYRFITELVRAEGWRVNRKRVRRQAELQVVRKVRKRRRVHGGKRERVRAARPNEVWSYDSVLDEYTRE